MSNLRARLGLKEGGSLRERLGLKDGGAVRMQDGGDPAEQMFNFNPMAAQAMRQERMRREAEEAKRYKSVMGTTPQDLLRRVEPPPAEMSALPLSQTPTKLDRLARSGLEALGMPKPRAQSVVSNVKGAVEMLVPDPERIYREMSEATEERDPAKFALANLEAGLGYMPFAKPVVGAAKAIGATALDVGKAAGREALRPIDQAMFGEGPLAGVFSYAAPLQAAPKMQAPVSPLGFYNPVEQAALNVQRKQGPGQAFLNELQRGENVSKDFLQSSGLAERLAAMPNVTREEVQAMTKGTVPEVQQVILGENVIPTYAKQFTDIHYADFEPASAASRDEAMRLAEASYDMNMQRGNLELAEFAAAALDDLQDLDRRYRPGTTEAQALAKYGDYTIPGGENYREMLLTIPQGPAKKQTYEEWVAGGRQGEWNSKTGIAQEPSKFQSSHWDQPNVLSHIRMNDRTDAEGKKVLFIEELQSDWAQEGRKKGFKQSQRSYGDIQKEIDELLAKQRQMSNDALRLPNLDDSKFDAMTEEVRNLGRQVDDLLAEQKNIQGAIPSAPFVQNTKDWVDLSLKNILKRAVDEGYDRVAFINGKQSADRYQLTNYVDKLEFVRTSGGIAPGPDDLGQGLLIGYDKSGQRIIERAIDNPAKQLPDYIGKEAAQKMLEQQPKQGRFGGMGASVRTLQGQGLEVGGTGMKKFYDEIVPERIRKLVGKNSLRDIQFEDKTAKLREELANATPGSSRYLYLTDKIGQLERDAERYGALGNQLGFDITPEIREKFSQPIPYKKGGAVNRVHISNNPDTMRLELAMGGPIRMSAAGDVAGAVARQLGQKGAGKAAISAVTRATPDALKTAKQLEREGRKIDLTGALKPLEPVYRGETSKELLRAQKAKLTDQEKETLEGFRQTYPDFSDAVKFMTPQEVSKIIRNPEGVAEMNRLLQVIPSSRELSAVAKAGAPKQGWYRASTQALIDVFGVQDAPRFASLLAAMSPQTSVESNLINALNTWKNWTAAGRPTDPKQIKAIMGASVQGTGTEESVLDAWTNNSIRALRAQDPTKVTLSGPKVDSFYRNLADDVYRVTNDAWMASGLGVNQGMFSGSPTELQLLRGDPGLSPGYLASSARIREAGQSANMLPSEAQETLWSFYMPLYEMQKSTGTPAREILQRGLLTPESIRGTPDFSTLLTQGQYGDVLRNAGYEQQLSAMKPYQWPEGLPSLSLAEQREIERSARRLESLKDLREKESRAKVFLMPEGKPERGFASAQIEYVPGEGTGILPDMINAPMGTRQHFSSRMAGAFKNPQERDILQMALGLEPVATRPMTGSFRPSGTIGFQGNVREEAREVPKAWETNPGYSSRVEVPLTKAGDIPKSYKDRLAAAEALRGYMTGQRGSTYNLQVPDERGTGMMIPLEKKADPEAMRLASSMTDEDVFLADTGQGTAVILNPYKEGNQPLGGSERKFLKDLLGGQRYVPTRNISDYIDYSEALTGPEGTGAATRLLGERLSPLSQAQQARLSEAAKPVAGDVLDIMTKTHERAERPMRADYARALELIKRGGIPALMAALAAGEALPAELISDLLGERQTQKNTLEIE